MLTVAKVKLLMTESDRTESLKLREWIEESAAQIGARPQQFMNALDRMKADDEKPTTTKH